MSYVNSVLSLKCRKKSLNLIEIDCTIIYVSKYLDYEMIKYMYIYLRWFLQNIMS